MEKKVLVVDDEDFHRELMQKLLSRLGYEVAVA
jgi:CheY-like chemotaxis protein